MIPKFVYPYLWFSDIKSLDTNKDCHRIILNVLNIGSKKATDWLFDFYKKSKIKNVVKQYGKKELSPKSLNYWMLMLGVNKKDLTKTRF